MNKFDTEDTIERALRTASATALAKKLRGALLAEAFECMECGRVWVQRCRYCRSEDGLNRDKEQLSALAEALVYFAAERMEAEARC